MKVAIVGAGKLGLRVAEALLGETTPSPSLIRMRRRCKRSPTRWML